MVDDVVRRPRGVLADVAPRDRSPEPCDEGEPGGVDGVEVLHVTFVEVGERVVELVGDVGDVVEESIVIVPLGQVEARVVSIDVVEGDIVAAHGEGLGSPDDEAPSASSRTRS